MENIRLMKGDCIEEMQKLIDEGVKVDMVLTDPPYGTTACKWDNVINFGAMWRCIRGLRNDNTPIVLFGKNPFTANLILSNIGEWKYDLIWEKSRAGNSMQVTRQPSQIHEIISVFYKDYPTYNEQNYKVDEKYIDKRKSIKDSYYSSGHHKGVMKRKADDGIRHPQSILYFNSHWSKGMHPTQKPLALLEYLIKTYTNEGDTVLDFTMGSGSTAIACINTNRKFIGIELDDKYFEIANKRILNHLIELNSRLFLTN